MVSFLLFSIVPTVILIFLAIKFMNASLDESTQVKLGYYLVFFSIGCIITFSSLWLGSTIAREFAVPLELLASATNSVAMGDYTVSLDRILSDDEIGKLAQGFKSMMLELKNSRQQLENMVDEIKSKAIELQANLEYNAILLKNTLASVIAINEANQITSCNTMGEKLLGFREKDILGTSARDSFSASFWDETMVPLMENFKSSQISRVSSTFSGIFKNQEVHFILTIHALTFPSQHLVLFVQNVTDLVKTQRLAAWQDVAKRLAHEIKNPLTPIKLSTQRLDKIYGNQLKSTEIFQECTLSILHAVTSIEGLIDEFSQFARMPPAFMVAGNLLEPIFISIIGFKNNPQGVPLSFFVVNLDKDIRDKDPDRKDTPFLHSRFDKDQIVRLMNNLVANAIAVSQNTPIEVHALYSEKEGFLKIQVKDWGPGISREIKQKIFEPYFSTKRLGTGLGLVIARQIAADHQGSISLENNTPKGSIFEVYLPLC